MNVLEDYLFESVRRGDLKSTETALSDINFLKYLEDFDNLPASTRYLLHICVENTHENTDEEIKDRIKIVNKIHQVSSSFLEWRNEHQQTPLICDHIHSKLLLELIKLGADVLAQDLGCKNTVFHESILECSNQDYHELITSVPKDILGKLVHVTNYHKQTPLARLVHFMDPLPETLSVFKSAGANFSQSDIGGISILAMATLFGRSTNTLAKLIECGASVFTRDLYGNNLLHSVVDFDKYLLPTMTPEQHLNLIRAIPLESLKSLVKMTNMSGNTPLGGILHFRDPSTEVIDAFREAEADFNHTNSKGETILIIAIKNGRDGSTIRKLIDCGASVHYRQGWERRNLLHYASSVGNCEAVELFVKEFGFNIFDKTWSWKTPLDYATEYEKRYGKGDICAVIKKLGGEKFNGQNMIG